MVCLPGRGVNLRALASGLSPLQMENHGIITLFRLNQCIPSLGIVCQYFLMLIFQKKI